MPRQILLKKGTEEIVRNATNRDTPLIASRVGSFHLLAENAPKNRKLYALCQKGSTRESLAFTEVIFLGKISSLQRSVKAERQPSY
jgi:hypothetical protein